MEIRLSSLPVGAFLMAHGCGTPRLEAVSDYHFEFCFEDPNGKAGELRDAYFRGAEISARDFYAALHDLRAAINRAKGGAR